MAGVGRTQQPVAQPQRVSIKRETFVEGGFLPEGDYLIKKSEFAFFQYPNSNITTTSHHLLFAAAEIQGKNWVEKPNSESPQDYSVGDIASWVPSEDGNFLCNKAGNTTLSRSSNFYVEWDALVNAGMPEDLFDESGASGLEGAIVHLIHIPAPDRSNMKQSAVGTGAVGAPKSDRPKTIPVVKSFHSAPWDGNKAKVAPVATKAKAAAPAQKQTEPESNGNGNNSRLVGFITDVVKSEGGTITRTSCRLKCFRMYAQNKIDAATRDAEQAVWSDDSALTEVLAEAGCVLEGGNIVLAQ